MFLCLFTERERGDRDRNNEPDRTDSDWRSKPEAPPTRMVTTTDITTMVDPVIVWVLEDTTVDLGIDRVTEDMTMDLLGTDQVEGTEGTMTDLGAETRDTRTAEETIGTGTVTGERDLAATGIMETETGMKWF